MLALINNYELDLNKLLWFSAVAVVISKSCCCDTRCLQEREWTGLHGWFMQELVMHVHPHHLSTQVIIGSCPLGVPTSEVAFMRGPGHCSVYFMKSKVLTDVDFGFPKWI